MDKTAVKRTGYTASTPKHYLINAGAIPSNADSTDKFGRLATTEFAFLYKIRLEKING